MSRSIRKFSKHFTESSFKIAKKSKFCKHRIAECPVLIERILTKSISKSDLRDFLADFTPDWENSSLRLGWLLM